MNAEKAIYHLLANSSTYNAHVGGSTVASRIFYDEVDQTKPYPNTMITAESLDTTDTKDSSNFDHDIIQVFHSAESKEKSLQMATDARAALTAAAAGTYNGVNVSEIRLIDQDSFTERVVNKKIFTTEQIYKVTVHL